MDLLEKASVILTPTAYNNGEALCIKPSDASGDFQFSRNSAATRVNAQGLVENVQILSSNLVQNGDFSNGSTDWNLGTGWSIGEDKAVADGTTNNAISQTIISSVVGKLYKIDFTIDDYVTGNIRIYFGGVFTPFVNANGVYSFYISATAIDALATSASGLFNGSITNISVIEITDDTNLPRINYEGFSFDGSGNIVPNSGCGSWLFEPQSTNLITQSELFSDGYWNDIDVSLESGYLAPDGTNSAYKVTSTGTQSHLYTGAVGGAIGKHKSIYARTLSGTGTVNLCNHNSDTNALFTITEQWQRFDISHSSIDLFYAVDFRGAGATLSEVIIWGAQLEQQSYATSYIPTSGSTVTRNQDVCTNGGSLATINSTEGVLYAEIAVLSADNINRYISLSNGTDDNSISFHFRNNVNNQIRVILKSGNVNQFDFTYNPSGSTDFAKVAFKYKVNDFALWVNGIEISTDTSGITFPIDTLNRLSFDDANGGSKFFGKTKALAVWKEALSDSELQSLTTI
jgi:hypothetical protein